MKLKFIMKLMDVGSVWVALLKAKCFLTSKMTSKCTDDHFNQIPGQDLTSNWLYF